MNTLVIYTTITLTLALIGGYISVRLKQYTIVGYIIIGMIAGSFILGNKISEGYIQNLSLIGVALLIFYTGTEFSISKIISYKKILLRSIFIQFIVNTLIITILLFLFRIPFLQSFIISLALSFSSTIIVSKVLKDLDRNYSNEGEITIAWLMLQDLISIPIILFIEGFSSKYIGTSFILSISLIILKTILILIVIYYLASFIIPKILREIAKTQVQELLIVAVITILFIMITFASFIGISPVIAAFIAGLSISKGMLNHEIASEIRPMKDIFSIFFFVLIGTLTPISFILQNIITIILIVILVSLIKTFITFVTLKNFKLHPLESFIISLNMFQAGEFSFILASIAYSYKFISFYDYHLLLSITIITIIFSPLVIKNDIKIYNFIREHFPFIKKYNKEALNISNFRTKIKENIVVIGYGRVGRSIVQTLSKNLINVTVIDFNENLMKGSDNKYIKFIYGNAESLDILKIANIDKINVLIITTPDIDINYKISKMAKNINPKIKIIARSHLPKHKDILSSTGVDHIIEPEKETAKSITAILLRTMGKRSKEIEYILSSM